MTVDTTFVLSIGATFATGLLAGASLDQSIKQLPARHRMGAIAFSAYARAADLGSGVLWYAILGVGSAVLVILAAVFAWLRPVAPGNLLPFTIAGCLALLHSFATSQAAPTYFSQRKFIGDAAALEKILDRFARWQTFRVSAQVLNFGAILWATIVYVGG